jgi:hypothetical protein
MTNRRKTRRAKNLSLAISDALLENHLGLDEAWDWESGPDISKENTKEPAFSNEIKALVNLGCKKAVLQWCVDYFLRESDLTFPDRKEFRSLVHTFAKASNLITKYSLELSTVAIVTDTVPPDWNVWNSPRNPDDESDLPSYEDLPLDMRCDHALAQLPGFLSWCFAVAQKWEAPDVRPAKNGVLPLSVYLELVLSKSKLRGRAGGSHNRVVQLLACTCAPELKPELNDETIKKNLYNFRRRSPRLYRLLRRALRQFHTAAKN